MAADPATWFLPFWSANPNAYNGDGRPWGDGTAIAARARAPGAPSPWDDGCRVTSYVKSVDAMSAMRQSIEDLITAATGSSQPVGSRGSVYFAGWRLNSLRDLSTANPWGTNPWTPYAPGTQARPDQSVVGLVIRLLQAGVRVRILVWLPNGYMEGPADLAAHVADERWLAHVVGSETDRLTPAPADPLGVVGLDLRTADSPFSSAHHQKMMVIRSPAADVAYVGGVDLAFTRRDAPSLGGDWQSGAGIPVPTSLWPKSPPPVDYTFLGREPIFAKRQASDLPANVYGDADPLSPLDRQIWHDQQLRLEGPIVRTIEAQFGERWRDTGEAFDLSNDGNWFGGQVIFSTGRAFTAGGITPLPLGPPISPIAGATTRVQMWRTIPLREDTRTGSPFQRGEFTVAAGIVKAVTAARQLIWIFDQYFWSVPFARLVNQQLQAFQSLNVIVIVPPHADVQFAVAHRARRRALEALMDPVGGAANRVAVYDMWLDRRSSAVGTSRNRGIYVHAKSHTYDNDLLVTGSANVNRRSFLCDTELACAVLDRTVVTDHQTRLWDLLFDSARPAIDLDTPGSGAQFMTAFRAAAAAPTSHLIDDPWRASPPTLPNGIERDDRAFDPGNWRYNNLLDPSSVALRVEEDARDAAGARRSAHLGDVVTRLEHVWNGREFPYRRS